MIYKAFHPIPALYDIVDFYWYASDDQDITGTQYFYTPLLQTLGFNFIHKNNDYSFSGKSYKLNEVAYLFGQSTSPRKVYTEGESMKMIGVKFKPTGISRLIGIPMQYIADDIIPADAIWGRELLLLSEALQEAVDIEKAVMMLETFLLEKMMTVKLMSRINSVEFALSLIHRCNGNLSIKDLQYQTNTSRKTFERTFEQAVGLMPKLYAEIIRFNAAKAMMNTNPGLSVSDIAFNLGYYDNSHLAAAFKRFCGHTPTAYHENMATSPIENVYFEDSEATPPV